MPKAREEVDQEKRTLLSWKTSLSIIVGLFLSGVVAVVAATSYLDEHSAQKFYDRTNGVVLEEKIKAIEEHSIRQEAKLDSIDKQQTQILIKLGSISGKLDTITP